MTVSPDSKRDRSRAHLEYHPAADVRDELLTHLPSSHVPPRTLVQWIWQHLDPREWIKTILHLDDSPHSIALGTAIGLFIGITPTGGIQMALVLLVAVMTRWLFRFNRIAALLCVYVSNPLTTLPLYWYSYRVGTLFFRQSISWHEFKMLFVQNGFANWWQSLKSLCVTVGLPILVGSVVIGAVVAAISYPVTYALARRVQSRRRAASTLTAPVQSHLVPKQSA